MADEETKSGGILQNKELMNALISGFDPEVADFLDKLITKIPPNSIWRNRIVDRLLGVAKSVVESKAEKRGPRVAVAGEKLTDYLDLGRTALTGKGSKEAKRKATEVNPVEWMNRFFQHAEKRLAEADDPGTEKERLDKEFQARKAIFDIIKEAEKAIREEESEEPILPAAESIDWDAKWQGVKDRSKKVWDKIDAGAGKAAPPVSRLADWLESKT